MGRNFLRMQLKFGDYLHSNVQFSDFLNLFKVWRFLKFFRTVE